MAKKNYPVNWGLSHNKKEYEEGDSVSLSEDESKPLLKLGVISEPVATKKKVAPKADAEKADAEKADAEKADAEKADAEKADAENSGE